MIIVVVIVVAFKKSTKVIVVDNRTNYETWGMVWGRIGGRDRGGSGGGSCGNKIVTIAIATQQECNTTPTPDNAPRTRPGRVWEFHGFFTMCGT